MNLLVIKTLANGTVERSLLNHPTENDALSAMYYELWYASSTPDVISLVAELISDDGRVAKCERYTSPAPIVEPVLAESEGTENVGND